ncbi:MAG TPA: hypothetical protein VN577_07465 [Terriglobales bacterium]|nr:hypothetical protein [Terriglobales bacterium]
MHQVDQWDDNFDRAELGPRWEKFSFEGPSAATVQMGDGILCVRGVENGRAGVRSTPAFHSDRFIFEAVVAGLPKAFNQPTGFASLTVLFDSSGRNRIEWILRSDGMLEAWFVKDGRGQRLDNKRMGTKEKSPTLGIVRRGDTLMFVLNGEPGIQKNFSGMHRDFDVMLYGWGTSESCRDSVRVVTPK